VQLEAPIWAAEGTTNLAGRVAEQETDLVGQTAEQETDLAGQIAEQVTLLTSLLRRRDEHGSFPAPHTNLADTMNHNDLLGMDTNASATAKLDNGRTERWSAAVNSTGKACHSLTRSRDDYGR
jgi:hypothetical protein